MTPRQLESRIRALRGSLRRLLALHGLSWVLGVDRAAGDRGGLRRLAVSPRLGDPGGAVGCARGRLRSTWVIAALFGPFSSGSPISISPCGSRSGGRA